MNSDSRLKIRPKPPVLANEPDFFYVKSDSEDRLHPPEGVFLTLD